MDVNDLVEVIEDRVRDRGKSPDQVVRDLAAWGTDEEALREALAIFRRRANEIRIMKIPGGFVDAPDEAWYAGPRENDPFWPGMKMGMSRLPPEAVDSIDRASTKIVGHLPNPSRHESDGRGLVLGYVQSGKTANYSAVIAKAADAGYKFVIVLSGVHEALRSQTQRRLEKDITAIRPELWLALTTADADFTVGSAGRPDAILSAVNDARVLAVVKKNGARLSKLRRWAERANAAVLASCPTLIIDDEADQASINVRGDDDPTVINERIRELLRLFRRSGYVGYTATPFANVLIGARTETDDDLYPRDFIFCLPLPSDYFGSERLFGRQVLPGDADGLEYEGLDVIRPIPEDELAGLQPGSRSGRADFEPVLTPSLERAVLYFWLATAIRWVRGQEDEHSSMLIHTTMYADVQTKFKPVITWLRDKSVDRLRAEDSELLTQLEEIWSSEDGRGPATKAAKVEFVEVLERLADVVAATQVVVENSRSTDRLSYEGSGSVQIVIGGNVLSRGLTLEGLVASYFVRSANAYDTLLQMGRWFGYRLGYEDAQRIWMTQELRGFFTDLATVEQEIRNDIARYEAEGLTPRQFGPRIRVHPALSITSALKMQHAVDAQVSFSRSLQQTILFNHRDPLITDRNLRAARSLASALSGGGRHLAKGSWAFTDVPVDVVRGFVGGYSFHGEARSLSPATLDGYIQSQLDDGYLNRWSVVFAGTSEGKPYRLAEGLDVRLVQRSRLIGGDPETARLGVITSGEDLVADLNEHHRAADLDDILQRRAGVPLLVIYLIDRDSQARATSRTRTALEAIDHLVGAAFLFPRAEKAGLQTYKTADLSGYAQEVLEYEPERDVVAEDPPAA